MNKKWYNSRTLWTNTGVLVASFGIYFETGSLEAVFPALLALANVILRLITTTPLEL
ncbi:hypothetical protein LCGC14_2516820 [marine sediment metagenome]|uniref:Uncharacterized protein n=1 Tax=marine sediment metagenome TaxID=412755 RepID=A0A0F9D968_9ZZZZ